MPERGPVHLPRFNQRGRHRYLLTFCTNKRAHVFVALDVVTLIYEQIRRAATETGFAVLAYCFMPDHLHLLIEGTRDDADGLRFISRAKQYAGYYHARAFGGRRLWQRYIYERVLREDEDVRSIARYVISNPVRAGLVARIEEYPFVGSDVYVISGASDVRLKPDAPGGVPATPGAAGGPASGPGTSPI